MKTFLITMIFFIQVLPGNSQKTDTTGILDKIKKGLETGARTTSSILTDSSLMYLHPLTSFREIIKENSSAGILNIYSKYENGLPIEMIAHVIDNKGNPLSGQLIYFYHTDAKGWYGITGTHVSGMEGDRRHARIFGYLKTDREGKVVFYTIKPNGYPGSELPAHIHFEIFAGGRDKVTELLFNDDARLKPAMKERALKEGAYISEGKKSAGGWTVYEYYIRYPY